MLSGKATLHLLRCCIPLQTLPHLVTCYLMCEDIVEMLVADFIVDVIELAVLVEEVSVLSALQDAEVPGARALDVLCSETVVDFSLQNEARTVF